MIRLRETNPWCLALSCSYWVAPPTRHLVILWHPGHCSSQAAILFGRDIVNFKIIVKYCINFTICCPNSNVLSNNLKLYVYLHLNVNLIGGLQGILRKSHVLWDAVEFTLFESNQLSISNICFVSCFVML